MNQLTPILKKLAKANKISETVLLDMIKVDQLTDEELKDLEYVQDRINTHLSIL